MAAGPAGGGAGAQQSGAPQQPQQPLQDSRPQQAQVQDVAGGAQDSQQMMEQAITQMASELGPAQAGQMLVQMGQNLMNAAPQQGAQQTPTPQAGPG